MRYWRGVDSYGSVKVWWRSKGVLLYFQVVYQLYIFTCFYNQISGKCLEIWVDHIPTFRQAFCTRLNSPPTPAELQLDDNLLIDDILQLDPATFRIWAVVDCTDMRTTRVGSGPMPDGSRRPMAFEMQREFYSRYFRAHGIKCLSIHLPNGLNGAVFGSRLSDNDNALLNLSGVSSYLMQILAPIPEIGLYPSIYGDSIMPLTPTIQGYIHNPDIIEGMRNRRMNSCRMCIEHGYGQLFNLFHIMIRSELHQMFYNGVHIFRLGI
jgi:hypothetical protein